MATLGDVHAEVPAETGKNLVACMVCRLLKTFDQRVLETTTINYNGMVAVLDPTSSWAAKWLHVGKRMPGCYALRVQADLPQHIEDILDNNNITWHRTGD
ncbi:hypothetical protein WJX81_005817 [Elliptochloris bilobata]|uniref:Spt4/RpoE2 zinc finger domain-containing protein n=1 Tax=Elliptochloris bilobata TaxID=381761 RepID=A0AAW1RNN3_9CHLO